MNKILSLNFLIWGLLCLNSSLSGQVQNTVSDTLCTDTLTIVGVGDIMPGTNFPSRNYLPPNNNCLALLSDALPWLQQADLTVGNLEGCLSDDAPLEKRCKDTTICYAFRMPELYGGCLKEAGFDLLTLANNHSGDFGDAGRQTTVAILDSLQIYHAGWVKHPLSIFTKNNITYGVAAFAPNKGTVELNNYAYAQYLVDSLNKLCDVVIVTFHAGAEGSKYQHVTRGYETFYGENRGNVYEFARMVIDAGADVVFGHGPHVPRAVDLYKDRFIAYSLGNFCTYGRFNLSGANGVAPLIRLKTDNQGKFIEGQILSAHQPGNGGVRIDSNQKAVKLIKFLTETDFPESPLIINDEGTIKKRLEKL